MLTRREEQWAAEVMRGAIEDAVVTSHDDGSSDRMYDLDLLYPDGRRAVVEVTTVIDEDQIKFWKAAVEPSAPRQFANLRGGWDIAFHPKARARKFERALPKVLLTLEQEGVTRIGSADGAWPGTKCEAAYALGVHHGSQSATNRPGSVYVRPYLPLDQSTGIVSDTGDAIPAWVEEWVIDPKRLDNLIKVALGDEDERHLFIVVRVLSGLPFQIAEAIMRDHPPVPTRVPSLPVEITHVWLCAPSGALAGIRWDPSEGWLSVKLPSPPTSG